MNSYSQDTADLMKRFYNTLSEKDKRRYAAIEAMKLGHGGITYVSGVLGCSRETIHKGIKEVTSLPNDSSYEPQIRQKGGGRKSYEETKPGIDEAFLQVIKEHTAGDPMDGSILWTNLFHFEISEKLLEDHGIKASETVVKKLLKKHGFKKRKIQKKKR